MKRLLFGVVAAVALARGVSAEPIRFGIIANRLTPQDMARITTLATVGTRRPWLLDGDYSRVLPALWFVYAHLDASAEEGGVRRGQLVALETPVRADVAQRWRVTNRRGAWAQVALPGKPIDSVPTARSLDRPFKVVGAFTTGELAALIQLVRSRPGVPAPPSRPDGSVVWAGTGTGTLEGRWPVIEATRVNPSKAEVWVANERASTMRGEFTIQGGRWALVFVEFGGIP